MNNFVTEISYEDFRKLDKVGYEHKRIEYDGYSKLEWKEVRLNDLMDESDKICEKNGWKKARTFIFALCQEPPEGKTLDDGYYYLHKYMTPQGATTIIQGDFDEPDVKLYSTRNYWEKRGGDFFIIPKKMTASVYVVRR